MKNWFKAIGVFFGGLAGMAVIAGLFFAIIMLFGPMWMLVILLVPTAGLMIWSFKEGFDRDDEVKQGTRTKDWL